MSDQQEQKGTLLVFATIGARTERGGCVTSASDFRICHLQVACVGDVVTYEDGSQAVIIHGAGIAMVFCGKPVALVGSSLSNGDRIVSTIWTKRGIFVDDGTEIEGFSMLTGCHRSASPPPGSRCKGLLHHAVAC